MDRINLKIVTDTLLDARRKLDEARQALYAAERHYVACEESFLKGAGAVEPGSVTPQNGPEWPDKVIVDDLVIIAVEDWWDAKPGARVEYHTVVAV